MPIKAGTVVDMSGSMALAIENALRHEWPNVMRSSSSFDSNPQLKLLCVAVAQGVVRYLAEHPNDFKVKVHTSGSGNSTGQVTEVITTGTLYT
jgi:hypothetical protein